MSKGAQKILVQSKALPHPNSYVKALYNDKYKSWIFDEADCLLFKGQWRKEVFKSLVSAKLDLEIGPGSGAFLEYLTTSHPNRLFIAIELKYKPLIQTVRRIQSNNSINARVIRYNACMLKDIFASEELNNVYIYFPDPWPKKRHHKHRLIKSEFINMLHRLQRKNSFVEIKTDHQNYYMEIQSIFKESAYTLSAYNCNLQKDVHLNKNNFITQFEKVFLKKNLPIYYLKYIKTAS